MASQPADHGTIGDGDAVARFDLALLDGLDEPVRRFLSRAIRPGAPLDVTTQLTMRGHIKIGAWLPFSADEEIDRTHFTWRARIGVGSLTLLKVVDRYAEGTASMEGRLFARRRLFQRDDEDTVRSAAGRTALEAVAFAPASLLPHTGVRWHAESDEEIVASWSVGPERPEVHVRIDQHGSPLTMSASRWGSLGRNQQHGYLPCGCEVQAMGRFGDLVLPARISVGWWFGTARYEPFFRAELAPR